MPIGFKQRKPHGKTQRLFDYYFSQNFPVRMSRDHFTLLKLVQIEEFIEITILPEYYDVIICPRKQLI